MQVNFIEEFPADENPNQARMINFSFKNLLVALSIDEFLKAKKQRSNQSAFTDSES